jgi:hypothetical protein
MMLYIILQQTKLTECNAYSYSGWLSLGLRTFRKLLNHFTIMCVKDRAVSSNIETQLISNVCFKKFTRKEEYRVIQSFGTILKEVVGQIIWS